MSRFFEQIRASIQIIHHIPGRLRLRVNPQLASQLSVQQRQQFLDRMGRLSGIDDLAINPINGSVTIRYRPERILPQTWQDIFGQDEQKAWQKATALFPSLFLEHGQS